MLTYVSYDQLVKDVMVLSHQVRGQFDAVCGIPRSGVIAASLMAVHLHLPLISPLDALHHKGKVLILDDSVYMGSALQAFKDRWGDHDHWTYGAVYASPMSDGRNDAFKILGRVVQLPRYFAWNLFHHLDLGKALLDIDGVLCEDPTRPVDASDCVAHGSNAWHADETLDGWYGKHLQYANPRFLPCVPVGGLVTCRLELFRPQTEAWLAKYGITYGSLTMSQYPNADARRRGMAYGDYKGQVLRDGPYEFMIESSDTQARWAAKTAGKPVICTDTQEVHNPE